MQNYLKLLFAGLPLALLASCSADAPDSGNQGVADKSETRYLKVNLVNAGGDGTRAIGDTPETDYANGTEAENKIRTVDFYLYDADKNYHSHVPMGLTAAVDPTKPSDAQQAAKPSVHGFYEANVPINLVQGEKMPQYVICIINAVHAEGYYENKSMEQAQAELLKAFYSHEGDGKTYFSMNNSVYYGRDEVTGQDNQLIMATPFDTDKLLTMTELEKLPADKVEDVVVDIYVERYAAKVNFSINEDAVKTFTAANNIELEFTPSKWGVNAYEKEFFFLKSFRQANGAGLDFMAYDALNDILFPGWNKPEHFRSFWARTPGYYDNDYPLVADDILDETEYPYTVYYQTAKTAQNTIGQPQYVIESTLKGSRLTGQDMPDQYLPLTSIPSVVLVGQYKIGGQVKTFYTYQKNAEGLPEIYAANDGDIAGVKTIHDRLLETQTVVLKQNGTGYTPVRKADLTAGANTFVVEHPKKDVRTGLKVGGDLVTLQVNGSNSGFYYYDSDTKQYTQINSAEAINKANRLLYQNLGGAHAYIDGMAFFSAPIQHWGWYREGNENKDKALADWDWSKMKTGDFGIVRNHVYTINIQTIAGLGTGIISTDDPLLPPTDKVSYAVKFRVNIQKWATLPTQTWEW